MIYIVTGLMRTGTSLMMQLLEAAGIPPHYSKSWERRSKGGRLRNPKFLEAKECIQGDISMVPDGHAVKVFLNRLDRVNLDPQKHRVIAMYRRTEDRLRSTRSGMPHRQWVRYREKCTHGNVEVEKYYDHLKDWFPDHFLVDFDALVDDSESILLGLSEYLRLKKLTQVAHVIKPELRHYDRRGK